MNKLLATLTVTLMLLVAQIGVSTAGGGGSPVIFETEFSYQEMVKRLNKAVKAEKMLIVTRASASAGAKNRGIQTKGNMVVGVFRNDFALRMLEASVDAGIEAPIRFYINERRDGSAKLSYKTPSAVFAPYLANAEPELKELAKELDAKFSAIANRAVAEN